MIIDTSNALAAPGSSRGYACLSVACRSIASPGWVSLPGVRRGWGFPRRARPAGVRPARGRPATPACAAVRCAGSSAGRGEGRPGRWALRPPKCRRRWPPLPPSLLPPPPPPPRPLPGPVCPVPAASLSPPPRPRLAPPGPLGGGVCVGRGRVWDGGGLGAGARGAVVWGGGWGGKGVGGGEAEGRSPPARKGKGEESSRLRAAAAAAVPLGEIPRAARGLWGSPPGSREGFAVPRAARSRGPSWGVEVVDPERRWSRRLAPGGGRGGLAVAPSSPGPVAVRPGPEPRPRPRSPLAIPAPLLPCRGGSRRGRVARGAAPRGCVPRWRPAGRRGVARRCALPPGLRPRRTACPEPALSRGGVVLRGGFRWLEACRAVRRARPGAAAGARGTWDVWGGRPGVSRGGKRAGGRGRPPRLDPPHARARFSPRSPAPRRSPRFPLRGSSRGGASRAPALPKPPFLRPLRLPTPAGLPPVPPARAPACPPAVPLAVPRAHPYLPRPPSPSRLSPLPRALASLSLPPSRRVWRRGGCWCVAGRGGSSVVGGWRLGRCVWGFASLGVGRRTGRVAERGLFPGPAFRSSRRPSALASRGSSWRARASLRDATSDQTWRPAEFKHISQRRKRN